MMNKKFTMTDDRFDVAAPHVPLHKRITGVDRVVEKSVDEEEAKPIVSIKKKTPRVKKSGGGHMQCNFRIEKEQVKALTMLKAKNDKNISMMICDAISSFINGNNDVSIDSDVNHSQFISKGVRMSKDLKKELSIFAVENDVDQSTVVRNAVQAYLIKNNAI